MKKILTTIAILISVFAVFSSASAQATNCSAINSTNYRACCVATVGGDSVSANNAQCVAYERANPSVTTTTTTGTNSCNPVTQQTFSSCCQNNPGITPEVQGACAAYYSSGGSTTPTTTTTNSCSTLTAQNFNSCCIGNSNTNTDLQNRCRDYYSSGGSTVGGQVGGTTTSPNTGAVNGGTTTTSYNTGSGAGLAATTADQRAVAACSAIKFKTLLDIAIWAKCIIGSLIIPGIFTLAFVVFLWGVFKFVRSSEQKDKQESKQFIYMGLIGLFVMVSVWGIIRIASSTLGLDTTVPMLQTDYLSTSKASK